jgi:NAD(P)-dependent dehydrogenase (short-subunit alcohol dehydrogenase family)/acyl carrier protein
MSHETYTPARGGSASAEIHALRRCFGDSANQVIIANTKGFTGHAMGVGIEDVVVTKALETGTVPPIAYVQEGFEPDPELGDLNLSKGGTYHPQFALRLGAGFGSQIAMTLMRRIPGTGDRIDRDRYVKWLSAVSGYEVAETELVKRTLRIKDQGIPARDPISATWQYGQLPTLWAMSNIVKQTGLPNASAATSASSPKKVEIQDPTAQVVSPIIHEATKIGNDAIKQHVLAEVSEKTGYPIEMLDLDLDMEADLGIDTVKQAELFAAIRTHYDIPRREDLILADYDTLAKVISFVEDNLGKENQTAAATNDSIETEVTAESTSTVSLEAEEVDAIEQYVVAEVSAKTGYPVEMLDLALDLEADLGIDTVKQAELFATIRTHFGIPRREDLILADYNTLSKVIGFVKDSLAGSATQIEKDELTQDAQPAEAPKQAELQTESEVSVPLSFRMPALVMIPKATLCSATQVELANREVMIVTDSTKVNAALSKKLKAIHSIPVAVNRSSAVEKIEQLVKAGSLAGVYYLPGLDEKVDWQSSTPDAWVQQRSQKLNPLFELAKKLPESAFLICALSMGGLLGFIDGENPQDGLLSGFVKALRRERPKQLIKLIDLKSGIKSTAVADILINETLHDPVTTEIGYEGESRFSVSLREMVTDELEQSTLAQNSVFVVSGATGGITAPVLLDLARATRGSFFLMGRTQLPSKDDQDLQLMKTDRNAYRMKLQKQLQEKGQKATPVQLDQHIMALERAAAMLEVIKTIQDMGGNARYIVCDVTNRQAVGEAINEIKSSTDHVDYFIHAAGIEKSRKIESKSSEEVEQTVSVKADGFYLPFRALEKANLLPRSVVFFSSVAGRFGNSGQTDYSAANDMLSKFAAWLPSQYPDMKAISIDWGAWGELGMASRGNVPMLMERAGIEMLKPASAAPMVRKALELGLSGEYVVAGSLGMLSSSCEDNCGVDVGAANVALRAGKPFHKMFSHLTRFSIDQGVRLETELDPTQESYLHDHKINGIPVLPGVIGIEGFSVAAKYIASVLGSNNELFEVDRLENVHFLAPFKFYGNKPRTIQWNAVAFRTREGIKVEATLESDTTRRNGDVEHLLHFTANVFLLPGEHKSEQVVNPPQWSGKNLISSADIYKLFFHGPSFQVLESAQVNNGTLLGKFNKKLVEMTADDPILFATPLLIEMCFQTASLYEVGATGTLALPQSVGTLKLFKQPLNSIAIYAEVKPHQNSYSFDVRVVDAKGNVFLELTDYRTSALPYPAEEHLVDPLKKLVTAANQ